jgi:hypothetical protein
MAIECFVSDLRATPTTCLFLLAKFGVLALCKNKKLHNSIR